MSVMCICSMKSGLGVDRWVGAVDMEVEVEAYA